MTSALVWTGLAFAALGHGFLWTGFVNRLHGLRGPRPVIKILTLFSVVAFAVIPAAIAWRAFGTDAAPFDPFGERELSSIYLWGALVIGVIAVPTKLWVERQRYDRSVIKKWTAEVRDVAKVVGDEPYAGWVSKSLGCIPLNESLKLSIDRKQLALPRLPEELEGLTIVHLSDLHMTGRLDRAFYEVLTRTVNDLRPDVIAITGDIIENADCWPWLEATIGKLCAPLGVYYVLGNHDAFVDVTQTRRLLDSSGFTSLSSRWLRAEWNGVTVVLGGNEMPWMPAADSAMLPVRQAERPEFRLILSHSPDQFAWCQRVDADLALAGHTHGGQVQVPLLGVIMSPSLHGTRYACGVFRRGDTALHVSRGISGEKTWRWRCPPEIALLELTRANDRSPVR